MRARHRDIIEFYIEQNLDKLTNEEQAEELTVKVNSVIDRLIDREGILIVSMDSEDKLDRELSINVNYEVPSLG
jgi:hypothetical protein